MFQIDCVRSRGGRFRSGEGSQIRCQGRFRGGMRWGKTIWKIHLSKWFHWGSTIHREGPFVRSTHLQAASGRKYTVGRILYPQGPKRYHVGSIRPGRTICRILPPSTGFMREVCLEEGTACNICSSPSGFINCGSTQRRTISRIHTLPSGFVWEVYGRDALRLILGSHLRPEASVC